MGDRDGHVTFFAGNSDGTLKTGERIAASAGVIKTSNSSPVITDWNEDGLFDLLLGSESASEGIRVYLNNGSKTAFKFTNYTKLQANGSDIGLGRCQIEVVDLNGDGKKDLIAGHIGGDFKYYKNIGTNSSPAFNNPTLLEKTDGSPIKAGLDTRGTLVDWNEDGVLDLVWSEYVTDSKLYLYLGEKGSSVQKGIRISKSSNIKSMTLFRNRIALSLEKPFMQSITVVVTSALGRTHTLSNSVKVDAQHFLFECENAQFSPGVYIVQIMLQSGEQFYGKVVLQGNRQINN